MLNACRELGVTLIAYQPLASGALTGKYVAEDRPTGLRRFMGYFRGTGLEAAAPVVALLREIGGRYMVTLWRDLDALKEFVGDNWRTPIVLFSTGADEKRIGFDQVKQQFERNFNETESSTITWEWRHVSMLGDMAWVAAEATIRVRVAGNKVRFPIRMTIVLAHRDGSWLWVHRHASVPAAGQGTGKSYLTPD